MVLGENTPCVSDGKQESLVRCAVAQQFSCKNFVDVRCASRCESTICVNCHLLERAADSQNDKADAMEPLNGTTELMDKNDGNALTADRKEAEFSCSVPGCTRERNELCGDCFFDFCVEHKDHDYHCKLMIAKADVSLDVDSMPCGSDGCDAQNDNADVNPDVNFMPCGSDGCDANGRMTCTICPCDRDRNFPQFCRQHFPHVLHKANDNVSAHDADREALIQQHIDLTTYDKLGDDTMSVKFFDGIRKYQRILITDEIKMNSDLSRLDSKQQYRYIQVEPFVPDMPTTFAMMFVECMGHAKKPFYAQCGLFDLRAERVTHVLITPCLFFCGEKRLYVYDLGDTAFDGEKPVPFDETKPCRSRVYRFKCKFYTSRVLIMTYFISTVYILYYYRRRLQAL